MSKKDITGIRGTLEYLEDKGEVIHIKQEVDPIYEIAGIQKALEGGPVLFFENIKGYTNFCNIGNLFSSRERIADLFDIDDPKKMKFRFLDAIKKQLPSQVVKNAPCQEVVITDNIDVLATLPVIKHTDRDAGRVIGCGIQLLGERYFDSGSNLSFNRIHFRGKDWASLSTAQMTHIGMAAFKTHRNERIPITVNMNPAPAVQLVAGTWNVRTIVHHGMDELGIAGTFQGTPVEIVKAKTVDAYAIASSEIVLEGYLEPVGEEEVWESDEAEKLGRQGMAPFFPEWVGYLGRSWLVRKLRVTAITHRKDKPIFYTPLAHSLEYAGFDILREASFFELAERIAPGIVVDVFVPLYLKWGSGVIFQVRKETPQEEGFQRNILMAALADAPGLRLAVAVDEDVNIYDAADVMWAIESRVDPDKDIITGPRGMRGIAAQPMEVRQRGVGGWEGGLAFDATKPYNEAWKFERPHYPVDRVNLAKWFTEEQLATIRAKQSEYARTLAEKGW